MRKISYEVLIFLLKKPPGLSPAHARNGPETAKKLGAPRCQEGWPAAIPWRGPRTSWRGRPQVRAGNAHRELESGQAQRPGAARADAGAGELTCRGRARANTGDGRYVRGRESRACVTSTCPGQSSLVTLVSGRSGLSPVRLHLNHAVTRVSLQDG